MYCLLKWVKFSVKKTKDLKKYWKNGKKYWKSQGMLSVRKSGNPDGIISVGIISVGINVHKKTAEIKHFISKIRWG